MKFKCVDELDKFDFQDNLLHSCKLSEQNLEMEVDGAIAKHNNPCNQRFEDFYIGTTQIRLQKPQILKLFLEGAKYYDADGVLLNEVADEDVPVEMYDQVMRRCGKGMIFVIHERSESVEGRRCVEIAVDVEEDTYWMLVSFEKSIVEWDRFVAKVEEKTDNMNFLDN